MNQDLNLKQAVISLSGGMDSTTLALRLLAEGYDVTAISVDYGQKHRLELQKAKDFVWYMQMHNAPITHRIISIIGLTDLLNSSLVSGGEDVPEGHYEQENMKQTVVPNRNKIFASIMQAIALSISTKFKVPCKIALGIHAGDHSIYPDCRQEFRDADFEAFKVGNWDAENVEMYTPYLNISKFEILQDGLKCCEKLGLDFDEVYKRTNTSYKPILVNVPGTHPQEYSDYKSASSVERCEAFLKLGRPDPVQYADETGLVSWETVVNHVKNVLENH